MTNRQIFKIASSLILASSLFTGCGSSNNSPTLPPKTESKIDITKKDELKELLKTRGVEYQNAAYSKDKNEIILIGTKDNKTTIYKFDAKTLKLIDEFSYELDGVINIKSGDDGIYSITAQHDSKADNYTFDSNSGSLLKKDEIILKDPRQLVKESLEKESFTLVDFIYSPKKYGAVVLAEDINGINHLYLYGLEEPNNPIREYEIHQTESKITDIEMLGGGKVAYKLGDTVSITYDYFHQKTISKDLKEPKIDKKDIFEKYIIAEYVTKYSARRNYKERYHGSLDYFIPVEDDFFVASISYSNPERAYDKTALYKIDDDGKVERMQTLASENIDYGGHKAKDIEVDTEKNIITYKTRMISRDIPSTKSHTDYHMSSDIYNTYNYKTGEMSKILPIKESESTKIDKKDILEKYIIAEYVTKYSARRNYKERYHGSLTYFLPVEDNLFVATLHHSNPDKFYITTTLFKIDDDGKVEWLKTLVSMDSGHGGDEARDIEVDTEKDIIKYKTKSDIYNTYNYKTGEEK